MTFKLRGPEGVRARIEELQARINPGGSEFAGEVAGAMSAIGGLSGLIPGSVEPMRPDALGIKVVGSGNPSQFRSMIRNAALEAGIDERLLDALVSAESNYNPFAKSGVGALGLTQLMPQTAASLGVDNPFDPVQNLKGGATYLAQMIKRFGDARLALAAYNAGPGAVEKAGGIPNYKETQDYVNRVMARFEANKLP